MSRNPRVLVVGDNDLAGLTTVRSLGRAGMDVSLVATETAPITRCSRYVRRVHHLGQPLLDPAGFVARLVEVLERHPCDLVIPIADKALIPLMERRAEVERHAPLAAPDQAAFAVAYHKDQTLDLARQLGVPTPRSWRLSEAGDLAGVPGDLAFPVVLKPSASVLLNRAERNEVRIVQTQADLLQRLPGMLRRCPVLLQEFCRGGGVGVSVLADRGELVAAFQHERVHEPPQGGASSYRRSMPLSPALLQHARALMRALRWTGPAMVEFKVDPGTGGAALMEINGRLWGSLALAVQAGVDFPRLLVDLFVRRQVAPVFTYRVPYYVRHTPRDLFWLWANVRTPAGRPDLLRRSAAEVLAEAGNLLRLREGFDLESVTDPLPALAAWTCFGREVLTGCRQRLQRLWYGWQARRRAAAVRRRAPGIERRLAQVRSVLFVCQGNVNRSALAEEALRRQPAGSGLRLSSAGLLGETGRRPSPLSAAVAAEFGVDLQAHRSTGLTAELLQDADLIVVMDRAQFGAVCRLHPGSFGRIVLLASFHEDPDTPLDIADPQGQSADTFRQVYRTVLGAVQGLALRLGQPPWAPPAAVPRPLAGANARTWEGVTAS